MTLEKASMLIGFGTLLVWIPVMVVLMAIGASGTALAVAMVLVFSVGGFFNYLATLRYSTARKHRH